MGRIVRLAALITTSLLVLGVLLLDTPPLNAQEPDVEALAARLAKQFKSGRSGFVSRVAVPDCIGPEITETHLDVLIADGLSQALQKSDSKLEVYPREQLDAMLSQNNLDVSALDSEGGKRAFLKLTNNTDFVVCHIQITDQKVRVDVEAYSRWVDLRGDKKTIAKDAQEFSLSPELEAAAMVLANPSPAPALTVPLSPTVQLPEMTDLAEELAKKLKAANLITIQVVDCCGIGDKPDIRRNVGDALRTALAAADPTLHVSHLVFFHFGWLTSGERGSLDSESFRKAFIENLKSDAMVVGEVDLTGARPRLNVKLYGKEGNESARASAEFPDLQAFVEPSLEESTEAEPEGYEAGKNGIGSPVCVSCPSPDLTTAALGHKTAGVVELKVWIDVDGNVIREQVLRGLPDGLTESALDKVRSWKFKAAMDSEGKPVPVFWPVFVNFQFKKK
jgi:TonB family protein